MAVGRSNWTGDPNPNAPAPAPVIDHAQAWRAGPGGMWGALGQMPLATSGDALHHLLLILAQQHRTDVPTYMNPNAQQVPVGNRVNLSPAVPLAYQGAPSPFAYNPPVQGAPLQSRTYGQIPFPPTITPHTAPQLSTRPIAQIYDQTPPKPQDQFSVYGQPAYQQAQHPYPVYAAQHPYPQPY